MSGNSEAKRAAAVAAVWMHLAQRKAGTQPGITGAVQPGPAAGAPGPWALYGRQALMNQRIRMQSRRRA